MEDRKQLEPLIPGEKVLIIQPLLVKAIGGINETLILNQLHYWSQHSKNERDGFNWVYKTYDSWNEELPFISNATIRRAIKKLEEKELVISGNYNRMGIDKTKWYRVNYEKVLLLSSAQNEQTDCSKCTDDMLKMSSRVVQNEQTSDSKRADELLTMSNQTVQNEQTNNHRLQQYINTDITTNNNSIDFITEMTDKDSFNAPSISNSVNSVTDEEKEKQSSLSSVPSLPFSEQLERVKESYKFAFGDVNTEEYNALNTILRMYRDENLICEAIGELSQQDQLPEKPYNEIPGIIGAWKNKGINSYEQLMAKRTKEQAI